MSKKPNDLLSLRDSLREFAAARDWRQYHTPKNLAMALIVEVAELVEQFQWSTPSIEATKCVIRKHRSKGTSCMWWAYQEVTFVFTSFLAFSKNYVYA
ncbi:MAG: hypothetical protein WC100_08305 [Sterolibacterium sp.]